jgi:methionine-gamma-lyase
MTENPIYTAAVHAGEDPQNNLGSLSVPLYNSAVFAFPDADQGALIQDGTQPGYSYGRKGNPTQSALETALCELEGGEAALAVSSGMAAITITLMTLLSQGDHIVASESLYSTSASLLDEILTPLGIKVSYVEPANPKNFETAITDKTKVLFIESPANPTLKLVDIAAICKIAKKHNLRVIMDNTFATPFNQNPLKHGIDLVIHSASKYLGGHGDLIAGGIIGSKEIIHRARWHTNKILGSVIAPHTAWLVLRGIRTLALRMERHNTNALAVAKFLEQHPKVKHVYYPGMPSHPQHGLAKKQMHGFGGVIAFEVEGGFEQGQKFVNSLNLCTLAVSLGNVETLIQHPASMTFASIPSDKRQTLGITDSLLRLSVGIERVEDIITDLENGLRSF